ncbi:unnamed protein product, partial [Nesidiocoris tenuis]
MKGYRPGILIDLENYAFSPETLLRPRLYRPKGRGPLQLLQNIPDIRYCNGTAARLLQPRRFCPVFMMYSMEAGARST